MGTGSDLREARRRLGLTQARAAKPLGTGQANVSAYESGRLEPGRLVGARIDALASLGPTSAYRDQDLTTVAAASAQLRADLQADRRQTDMLRVVIQSSDDFARLDDDADRALFLAEPSPTGSRNWDALLAGLAVHLCRTVQAPRAPRWTADPSRTVDFVWWVDSPAVTLHPRLVQDAIPSMRSRGVMLSRRALESV
jgi:transcriptional regulator with XRE-family HTH domain